MIPITLTIQGLYSYKESQKIDFQALTSSGIFGIFGAVGSGKSSILEAIMFVLFEKSDRLNIKNDNRYYNMLNLQSDELMIDFVFFAGSNNADKFRFRFVARRNRKDFEKVEPKESNRYKWVDEEWLPLDQVKDASEILGMSYENFMQTIIIPQGKFREFVDRSAVERTKMLKELFHLDRFDLSEKTNKLISNNKQEIDRLEGKLEGLGEVDQQDIDERLKLLQDKQSILEKQQVMCRLKKSEEQNLQRYRKIFSDIRVLELNKKQLDEKKEYFESKERLVQSYEKAFTYLKVKILIREGLKSELQKADAKKEELQIKLLQNEEKLFVQKEKLQSTKEAYLNRHKITEQCEDLENIIGIKAQNDKIEKLNIKIKKEKDKYAEEESFVAGLQNTFLAKEIELEQLEKDIPDHSEVHQVYHWKKRCKELQVELENQQKQLNKYIQKLENVETEKSKFFSNGKSSLSFESISTLLNNELEQYEVKKTSLYKDLQHLVVQQKLADLSINLKEGEACPLCGSSNHPAVLVQNDVLHVVEQKENELNEVVALQDKIRNHQSVLQKLQQEFKHHNTLAQEQEKIIKAVLEKTENHEQDFIWVNYKNVTEDQLTSRIKLAEVQKNKILALKKELKVLKDEVTHKDDQLKKLKELLNKLESELYAGQAVRDSREGQLKQLKVEKFEHFSVDQLKESLQRGRNQLQEVEDNYEKAVEYQNQLEKLIQSLNEHINWSEKEAIQLECKLKSLSGDIEEILKDKGFDSLEQVNNILKAAINLEIERKELDQYYKDVHANEIALEKNYRESVGVDYQDDYHNKLILELEVLEDQIKAIQKEVDIQGEGLKNLIEKLSTKKVYEAELEKLKIREQNLKELRKLFMGNGFVRYVSTIYLQDLCKAANQRFFKLTNNNLSLELNGDEEFIVRDYLNNGKTRLLKTLSGGQTFQAALCLALALAENIKSLNKADQSFFFLDEGFGSLDKESLRVVFDTLKSLRKENRIVGIISHVEELQQEIDVYLKVVNDKEKGSVVHYSWK